MVWMKPSALCNISGIIHYRRRDWKYQRGNLNLYIEEEQTTQWPKEKVHNDKQRSTKHTHKTKDLVSWTPLRPGGELDNKTVFPGLYGKVCILRTCGKHLHDRIISLRGEVWTHKTSLTPPLFLSLKYLYQVRDHVLMCYGNQLCQQHHYGNMNVFPPWSRDHGHQAEPRHLLLKCMYHARKVSGHVYVC